MTDYTSPPSVPEDWPAIDVVIATHNRPELLRSALAAVVEQTYPGKINTIVVFDRAEPDNGLVASTPGRSVDVITNTRTPGLAGARNSGIEAGSGDVVAFCDDDDTWLPDKLRQQVEAMQASNAVTCVTGIVIEYEDRSVERLPSPEEVTFDQLVENRTMAAHPSSVVVRRSALVGDIGLVDEEIPGSYAEDFDWILRAALVGPIAVVERPLVRVRWGQSLFSRKWQVIIEALDYLMAKFPAFAENPRAHARLLGQQSFGLAALGRRREAVEMARRSLRCSVRERRAYLAIGVAGGLISADRVMSMAHRRGRGI